MLRVVAVLAWAILPGELPLLEVRGLVGVGELSIMTDEKKDDIPPARPPKCFMCDGTGKLCPVCGEPEKACHCGEDFGSTPAMDDCPDCSGTGK